MPVPAQPRDPVARVDREVVLQHLCEPGGALGHLGIREDVRTLAGAVLDDAFTVREEPASTEEEVDWSERQLHASGHRLR